MSTSLFKTWVAGIAIVVCGVGSCWAIDLEQEVEFRIPAQQLDAALVEFSKQARLQVVTAGEQIRHLRSEGVTGRVSVSEALGRILGDSGLSYRAIGESAISIGRFQAGDTHSGVGHGRSGFAPRLAQVTESSPAQGEGGDEEGGESEKEAGGDLEQGGSVEKVAEEVVVTGTHIRGIAPDSSPVTTYDREYIESSGAITVDQLARQLPQNLSSTDSTTFSHMASSGLDQVGLARPDQAGMNLRGLGPSSTLVLVNGHRLAPVGVGDFVNIAAIPLSAVERVEVLSDGASAIYGADAIAGVVNFILRREFEGAETSIRRGAATRGGGEQFNFSQLLGHSWSSGNGLLVYEFDDQDGILSHDRSFVPIETVVPINLTPIVKRQSVMATARQDGPMHTDIFMDAFYTESDYTNDSSAGDASAVDFLRSSGNTKQYGGALSLNRKLAQDWQANLAGTYSQSRQEGDAYVVTPASASLQSTALTDISLAQVDLKTDGALFSVLGRVPKLALGASARSERMSSDFSRFLAIDELKRDVFSIYGEIFVPILDEKGANRVARRLELSVAGRFDDYSDMESSANPKFGLLWSPLRGVNLRATYATSYRVPLLREMVHVPAFRVANVPDPAAPDGVTVTLLNLSNGDDLKPEESETFTAGIDVKVSSVSIAATYFNTRFNNRLGFPPLVGGLQNLYLQEAAFGPLIDRSPDSAEIAAIFASGAVRNPQAAPGGATSIEAVFQNKQMNIASSKESGVDLAIGYSASAPLGEIGLSVSGTYLFGIDHRALATTPRIDFVNKTGQLMDWRLRSGITWSFKDFNAAMNISYSDNYDNNFFTPARSVDSWATGDVVLSYAWGKRTAFSLLQDVKLALSVLNVTDEDPPLLETPFNFVNVDVGYDPTNASPVGRSIALQVSKKW